MESKTANKRVVVKTVQTIVRTYFVEVPDPNWAADAITINELEEYSQKYLSEDIVSMEMVEEWPELRSDEIVNAAVEIFDEDSQVWERTVLWRS